MAGKSKGTIFATK